ncbi:uroporphyrin-III C-methyltransferase/precorrin-2 dehydrogenase/sirohydrochlorin ferrochelatase [Spinactinospora alkalitolerans]|uniref:Uroporphyrin-III C-methyltransferase/precorrin-2 dehydrogenase/sirohydrochlorin ferrochelatase n=1 Tax=Spinactinospora alkalitolerans TaxID=687207 RepID=A0A852TSN2_9ACTN|nr:uroporphyrinogen-III C-methyltransferase [Spinactinospora alkalitolerans]NYE46287.1 uroporphyrin-III C-methyltransferase/precorrin-2 dehydrogenase/sirohydrochlorin ferrochelatase [Spinactinospora alkalitolerans]
MTYLLGLRLDGRDVLVVGGGRVAQRRVPVLLDAGARVTLISPEVTATLEDLAAAGRLSWERRGYRPGDVRDGDLGDFWLVHVATDDPGVNAAVAEEADSVRVWCVRADDRHASSAWTPASGSAAGVTVGVIADGDPRRAAGLRDAVTEGLAEGTLDARRGREPLRGVALVGGGPGDPGLITVRGRQLLSQADVVVVDRLAPTSLLDQLPGDVEIVDAAKIPYGRSTTQEEINRVLVDRAKQGRFVVRLKGGDSFLFGRGAEEAAACVREGVPVTVVPGVTSALAGPAAAGIPATHRGVAQDVHIVSAHVAPDDERSTVDWGALARVNGTVVVLMGVERIGAIAAALIGHGRAPDTPVAIVQDATLPTQRTVVATLETVEGIAAEGGVRPPAIVVIGEVVNAARELDILHGGPDHAGSPPLSGESAARSADDRSDTGRKGNRVL